MAEIGNSSVFSQTDANNNSGTLPTWAENMQASQVNDSARALQGAITREWNWRNPTVTSAGTNTVTLTYSVAPAAYYNGQVFRFLLGGTNTGVTTLNVNGLGAKTVRKLVDGVSTNLSSGDWTSGNLVEVAYNSSAGHFYWINQSGLTSASIGTTVQAYNANLDALAAVSTTGFLTGPSPGTLAARTITGTTNQISVSNGNGGSGNPTLSIPSTFVFPGTWEVGTFSATGATGGKATGSNAIIDSSRAATAAVAHYRMYNPNGQVGSIETSGSATQFQTSSDERLKENFRDFDSGAIVDAIHVYCYQWKADGSIGYGPKAQELHGVFPQAVKVGGDDPKADPWGYDASKLVPVLIREIQALRARVAALES